jgi:hypothetical protein
LTTLSPAFEAFCAKRRKEREEFEKKYEEELKKKEHEEKERLRKAIIKKEITGSGIEGLAKPKDRLQAGKALLMLKKMFPGDKILQRMLLEEFKKNKLSKYPEEYDVYDSDEEIEIRKRDEPKEPFAGAHKEGRSLNLKDLARPINERESEIMEPFKKYLDQRYLETNLKLENDKHRVAKELKEDKSLDRFIAVYVRKYLEQRKKRLYEKTPTLKQFLIKTYKEMLKEHPSSTNRRFPHVTYGYSKRLKGLF